MFSPAGPAPDVTSIEVFPAPFQPLISTAAAEPAALHAGAAAEPEMPSAGSDTADGPSGAATLRAATRDQAPDSSADGPEPALSGSVVSSLAAAATAPDGSHEPDQEIEVAPRTFSVVPRAEAARGAVHTGVPPLLGPDYEDLVRRVGALLPGVGPLVVNAAAVHGITLVTATSPALGGDVASAAAGLVLPVVTACRRPWPIDQVTLSGQGAVVILTPLGPFADGGPVLAIAVPPGGSVALLELRCRQAAAERVPRRAADVVSAPDDRDEPDLLDVESSTRTREVASSLGALGTVTASTLRDADADRALYLFLPPGSDVRALGALAHDVCRVMRGDPGERTPFRTVVLRSGARRMIIRLSAASSALAGTVVAAGETARPGLAYRQVERAAAALGAL
jgi:hypothetical protein